MIIRPRPPFDFSRTAAIFASGDPAIRSFTSGTFRQVLALGKTLVLVEVTPGGSVGNPELSVAVQPADDVPGRIQQQAGEAVSRIFSTGDDLLPFYSAVQSDPIMTDLIAQLHGLRAPATPTVFEALTDSIIEQQISLKAARSIENRLIRTAGRQLELDGCVYYAYPDAETLSGTSDCTFRTCGLTTRKGEYIRDISRQIVSGDLDVEAFRDEPETESVITEMIKLRGIGRWTAELTLLRGLHRPDAFPADDIAVRRFITQYYLGDQKITSAECRVFAERWGAWKGFAAYYLEVADLLGIRPRHPPA